MGLIRSSRILPIRTLVCVRSDGSMSSSFASCLGCPAVSSAGYQVNNIPPNKYILLLYPIVPPATINELLYLCIFQASNNLAGVSIRSSKDV